MPCCPIGELITAQASFHLARLRSLPKDILVEGVRSFKVIYKSRNMDPNCPILQTRKDFSGEMTKSCEGVMSIDECERVLKTMKNNKTPGTDG